MVLLLEQFLLSLSVPKYRELQNKDAALELLLTSQDQFLCRLLEEIHLHMVWPTLLSLSLQLETILIH
jgi:hypothetical protein